MKRIFSNHFFFLFFFIVFIQSIYPQTNWLPFSASSDKNPTIKLLSFDTKSAIIEITLQGLAVEEKIEKGEKYKKISLPEFFNSTKEIGKANLPFVSFSLGVPETENISYTILDSSIIKYTDFNIYPVQEPITEGKPKPFVIDDSFYKTDAFYPASINENSKANALRNIRMMHFNVCPFKSNPVTKELFVYNKLRIRIEFNNVTNQQIIVNNSAVSSEWDKMYASSIINYDFIKSSLQINPDIIPTEGLKTFTGGDYDYLIITPNKFSNDIKRFADWKIRKGFRTKIKTLTEIGGNNWLTIKNFITTEYANSNNLKYILLVGSVDDGDDIDKIPLAMVYPENWS